MTADTGILELGGADEALRELSRREFLNYAWLASLGAFTAQLAVITYQFAMPRLKPGDFGGPVNIGLIEALPAKDLAPANYPRAKFWWVMSAEGAKAIYKVCTHLGCIYAWKPDQNKFICPCHGSQFQREGEFIQGPAPRSLDQMVIRAYDAGGALVAETNDAGDPLEIPLGATVVVETGLRIKGQPKA